MNTTTPFIFLAVMLITLGISSAATATPDPITCTDPTPNFDSGRLLLEHWDTDNDHIMSVDEQMHLTVEYLRTDGVNPTLEEWDFCRNTIGNDAYPYNIDEKCPTTPVYFIYIGAVLFVAFLWLAFRKRPQTKRR